MTSRIHTFRYAAYKYVLSDQAKELLPKHYLQRCEEFMTKDPIPVHWRPNPAAYRWNLSSQSRVAVQNVPVKVLFPKECNAGLWGGEGFVMGFRKKNPKAERKPFLWRPYLTKRVLYSEILDKRYEIEVTMRTLKIIDDLYGLDHYILGTHEVDLNSQLAMHLRRDMLLAIVNNTLYPNDPEKREKVLKKYRKYIIPKEEAEWVGLTLPEALKKAKEILANQPKVDYKQLYREKLYQKLADGAALDDLDKQDTWMSKLNPFSGKKNAGKQT